MKQIDVLIPTYNRTQPLALTLESLVFQEEQDFNVIISDQSDVPLEEYSQQLKPVIELLRLKGHTVTVQQNYPRLGMAQQRQFLLAQSQAPYCLFLDDDVIIEPFVIKNMLSAIKRQQCGFVGQALIGLSFRDDFRPAQQKIEFWEGPVEPEKISPDLPSWQRHLLHNAANVLHVQQKLGIIPDKPQLYKIAWVGGCVLYDSAKLRDSGGFEFWKELPSAHAGEDVMAQLRVMNRYGGCGILPSGAYHQELPTTVKNREVDAPKALRI